MVSFLGSPHINQALLTSPQSIFSAAISLRLVLLLYGIYQDSHAALKYTDVDYYVFTDAARYIQYGYSPYIRDTYRYTPLLAWILLPTTWQPPHVWFHFGKALFAACDIVAGWMMFVISQKRGLDARRALNYSAMWLLNPMVATISTRGSSEGLLCVMAMALLWAAEMRHVALAGVLLGASVHLKIYPFIYGVSILLSLEETPSTFRHPRATSITAVFQYLARFFSRDRSVLVFTSLATFSTLNIAMYTFYGMPFMQHTYLHHMTRIDHRHNFSVYNILLHLSSANPSTHGGLAGFRFESVAFIPQLILSTIVIPLTMTGNSSLPTAMLAQTFSFVTFNKVCTSQYFLWYLVFLPIYLPNSILMRKPTLGLAVLATWVAGQAVWLWEAYKLEMLGESTFVPDLWLSGLFFFGINCWILGIIVADGRNAPRSTSASLRTGSAPKAVYADPVSPSPTQGDEVNSSASESDVEETLQNQRVDEVVPEEMLKGRGQGPNRQEFQQGLEAFL